MLERVIYFFFAGFSIVLSCVFSSPTDVDKILQQIPDSDRKDLDRFFQLLIRNEAMGFTLFGKKPITVADFILFTYEYPHSFYCTIFEKGWSSWLRWRHLIPTDNFVIKRENSRTVAFYLINKKYTLETIYEHLDLLRKNLGENISAEEILERICSDEQMSSIITSEFLWGVFFGFGKNNSLYFQKRADLYRILGGQAFPPFSYQKLSECLCPQAKRIVDQIRIKNRYTQPKTPNITLSAYATELNQIMENEMGFDLVGSDPFLELFTSPQFVCWDIDDLVELRESYSKTRSVLQKAYSSGSFLEVTLKQWISPK